MEHALEQLATASEGFIRSELLRAADLLSAGAPAWKDAEKAKGAADDVVERLRPGLTISDDDLKKFRDQRKRVSRPVTEGFGK